MAIKNGNQVALEYTLSLEDGTTVDSNVGKEPLVYTHGEGKILPALERELGGLKVNDSKKVMLPPEEGFGPVDPAAFREVKPEAVPDDARKAGTMLVARDKEGSEHTIRVHEVHDDKIILDLNHPLAGKKLHFDVKVLDIRAE